MLTTSVTVSHKIQTAPYESAEISVTVDGIEDGTTPDEIDMMLAQGRLAYTAIRDEVKRRTAEHRKGALT